MSHFEYTFKTSDNLDLYAQTWQPETTCKAVVCVVHGLGEHSGRYAHVGAYLNERGYQLAGFDLRGHGKSPGLRGHSASFDLLLDDLNRFILEVRNHHPDLPVFLYGHSLGANLVLDYLFRGKNTVAGIVFSAPSLRLAFKPPAWKLQLGKLLYILAPTLTMTNELERKALSRDPAVVHAYETDPLVHNRVSSRLALDLFRDGEKLLADVYPFKVPTLLMHGSADRLTSVEASRTFAAKAGENCTLKIWEGFYHEVHNEPDKEQVLSYLVAWLNSHLVPYAHEP